MMQSSKEDCHPCVDEMGLFSSQNMAMQRYTGI